MATVQAVVASDGDGWLTVATSEWVLDKIGEPDDDLTEDLADWQQRHPGAQAACGTPIEWAHQRFAHVTGPTHENPHPVIFNSANSHNLLTEDICVAVMDVHDPDDGMDLRLAVIGHDEVYVMGPNQEWTDAIDWSRAYGGCPQGHTFTVEEGCYLHSDQTGDTHRLTEQARLTADDRPYFEGQMACPDCGQPLGFDI